MAYRELELTLLSARDLKNVNLFMRMEVYAVASISGDPTTRQRTGTDTFGGRDPSWDATLRFSVPPTAKAAGSSGWLYVLLRCERLLGDRDVGEVIVPLAELLRAGGADDGMGPQGPRTVWYQVHTVDRREPRGVLNVSYRLGPVVAPVSERDDGKPPVLGVPAQQQPFINPQNPAPWQKPSQPQNPVPAQQPLKAPNPPKPYYHPPDDSCASQQPFKPENPAAPKPHHPPDDVYGPPQPFKNQNLAPTQQSIKLQNPPPPLPYPYGAKAPPSPAKGKSNGHETTQVTQIVFVTPPSNTIPAKPQGPSPKPSYTPTHPITSSVKTDHSWPKAFPQHQDTPTWTSASPKKPDLSTRSQLGGLSHTPSKIDPEKTTDRSARPQGPKQAYAYSGSNNMTGGKADNHMSGSKVVLPIERMPSMTTAIAR